MPETYRNLLDLSIIHDKKRLFNQIGFNFLVRLEFLEVTFCQKVSAVIFMFS